VAVSADGDAWFLINVSPDLRGQIEAFPALHARPDMGRNSPIEGVFLTNADLDHTYGLPLLRESPALAIHAPAAVRESLQASGIDGLLSAFCRTTWHEPPREFAPLMTGDGRASGLRYRFIPLPGGPPRFLKKSAYAEGHSGAYVIADLHSGARLLAAPDVAAITPELAQALAEADIVLFDGTFWTSDEMLYSRPDARSAEEMGHLPIRSGSLEALRASPARYKAYLHINNTNPMLSLAGPERTEVETAGIIVGYDGLEFTL